MILLLRDRHTQCHTTHTALNMSRENSIMYFNQAILSDTSVSDIHVSFDEYEMNDILGFLTVGGSNSYKVVGGVLVSIKTFQLIYNMHMFLIYLSSLSENKISSTWQINQSTHHFLGSWEPHQLWFSVVSGHSICKVLDLFFQSFQQWAPPMARQSRGQALLRWQS